MDLDGIVRDVISDLQDRIREDVEITARSMVSEIEVDVSEELKQRVTDLEDGFELLRKDFYIATKKVRGSVQQTEINKKLQEVIAIHDSKLRKLERVINGQKASLQKD